MSLGNAEPQFGLVIKRSDERTRAVLEIDSVCVWFGFGRSWVRLVWFGFGFGSS